MVCALTNLANIHIRFNHIILQATARARRAPPTLLPNMRGGRKGVQVGRNRSFCIYDGPTSNMVVRLHDLIYGGLTSYTMVRPQIWWCDHIYGGPTSYMAPRPHICWSDHIYGGPAVYTLPGRGYWFEVFKGGSLAGWLAGCLAVIFYIGWGWSKLIYGPSSIYDPAVYTSGRPRILD